MFSTTFLKPHTCRATLLTAWLLVINAATPSSAQSFLNQLERASEGLGEPPAANAEVAESPVFLGITADNQSAPGLIITSVTPRSPAAAAGIRAGDHLLTLNNQPLEDLDALATALEAYRAGQSVTLGIRRGESKLSLPVELAAAPPQDAGATPALDALERSLDELPPPQPRQAAPPARDPPLARDSLDEAPRNLAPRAGELGVEVAAVTPALRAQHDLPVRSGAVIEAIVRGSPADQAELPLGAAIVAVDGFRIDDPFDLAAVIGSRTAGDEVEISYFRGDRMLRKRVRLAPSAEPALPREAPLVLGEAPRAAPPAAGVPLDVPRLPGERPAGRAINRLLDGLLGSDQGGAAPPPAPPPPAPDLSQPNQRWPGNENATNTQLRQRVESLEKVIRRLEDRIEQLEAERR